jgi:hypothetical protein
MARYRVTLRVASVEIVDADNPYQAAVVARDLHGDGVEIADVRPAVGRGPTRITTAKRATAKKAAKKTAKKRRLSPEARAKLAQNLVKARAARARNLKAVKKSAKKTAKKVGRPAKRKATKRA